MKLRGGVIVGWLTVALLPLPGQAPVRATTEDGRKVLLNANGTWVSESAALPLVAGSSSNTISRSASATTRVAIPFGEATFWIDPAKWKEVGRDGGRITFQHTNGKLYGLVLSENLAGIPTSEMKQVALLNARRSDPKARVVDEDTRSVNGRNVLHLTLAAMGSGLPFRFSGYFHGGVKSDIQAVAYTMESEFEGQSADAAEFIAGLEIAEASAPEAVGTAGKLSFGQVELNYDNTQWLAVPAASSGQWTLASKAGDGNFAQFLVENLPIPMPTLLKVSIDQVRAKDPQVRVISEDDGVVQGVLVKVRRFDATIQSTPLSYLAYYYGGKAGAVQVITWSAREGFDAKLPALRKLLDGLVIHEQAQ